MKENCLVSALADILWKVSDFGDREVKLVVINQNNFNTIDI